MSSKQIWIAWTLMFAGVAAVGSMMFATSETFAQPEKPTNPQTLLPANAVAYVGWDGNAAHEDAWKKTAAYKSLYDSGLMDLANKVFTYISSQAGEQGANEFLTVWNHITAQGFSMTVSIEPGEQMPKVYGVIVLPEAKKLEATLRKVVTQTETGLNFEAREVQGRTVTATPIPDTPAEMGWWTEGKHLVITVGVDAVNSAVNVAAGKTANITTSENWKKYRGNADFEVALTSWFNFGELRKMFGGMPVPVNPQAPITVADILKMFGLDNIGSLVFQSGFKDKATWAKSTLEVPGPRKGLMSLFDQKPFGLSDLPPMPKDSLAIAASSMNWSKFYEETLTTIRTAATEFGSPDDAAQVEGMIQQLPRMIGFDPKKGLFDSLGNIACVYGDDSQGPFGFGFGLAVQVKDEARLNATLRLLMGMVVAETGPDDVKILRTKKHGREIVTLEIGRGAFNPSYVIDDGWMVVGLIPQVPEAYLLRKDGKLPSWKPNEELQAAFAELPEKFTSLTITDPERTYKVLMGVAPWVLGFIKAGISQQFDQPDFELPFSVADFPPAELIAAPLFPNVAVSTSDDNTVTWMARRSAPSIPFLGEFQAATAVPILVALLLPAVQQARQAARRSTSKNNMKQIVLALHNYHDTYREFPRGTIENKELKTEESLSWLVSILPFIEEAALSRRIDTKVAWNKGANANLIERGIMVYQNPGVVIFNKMEGSPTHYVGLGGLGKDGPTLPVGHKRAGVFGYNRGCGIRNITDGTSNTAMISECTGKSAGAWAQGGVATIRSLTQKPYINGPDGIGGPFRGGCNIGMADGSVRFVSENINPTVFEALNTMSGGEIINEF